MPSERIHDAALLAAAVGPGEALSPREHDPGVCWLDLRGCRPATALPKVGSVVDALHACLELQQEAALFVTVDAGSPDAFAAQASSSLRANEAANRPVAVLRGEDVLSRLEEFFVAGHPLPNLSDPSRGVRDLPGAPIAALAEPPPAVLREAIDQGAGVIVTRTATHALIERALTGPAEYDDEAPIAFRFPAGETLKAVVDDPRPTESLRGLLADHLPASVTWTIDAVNESRVLTIESDSADAMKRAQRVATLLLRHPRTPLRDAVVTRYDEVRSTVPRDAIEFGWDFRSPSEWLE